MHRLDIPASLRGLRRQAQSRSEPAVEVVRPPREVLRPEFLASLKRLDLRAKALLRGFIQGQHRTRRRGFSAEFSDHRTFVPGDDARFIDWRLFARTDRFFVKCFEAESALRATLVLDASGSMAYRSPDREAEYGPVFTKLGYAVTLAAACVYLLQQQRDRVGLFCTGGSAGAGAYLPPRSARAHLRRVVESLSALKAGGEADLPEALESLALHERRRGMVLIFSDGLCGRQRLLSALRQLQHRGHELIFFQLWDPEELDPRLQPGIAFRDPETQSKYEPLPPEEYTRRAQTHLREIREGCLALGVEHQFLLTTTAFDRALIRFLRLRRRRH
jgi:uncharacterized protein (DUF58 family)